MFFISRFSGIIEPTTKDGGLKMLKTGDKAPAFTLTGIDAKGKEISVSLKDFMGKKVVLYFYPRDNTPGCTTEACDFRDSINRVTKTKATLLGVSPDNVETHTKFRDKQNLNFTLLSDTDKKVAEAYGAYGEKKLYGKVSMGIIRSTFIIDEKGKISHLWSKVKVKGHVDEVLEALSE
jgi:peroxiredoxin Q/BCP